MAGTPAINEYIHDLISADPWLRANGFRILREVASMGFRKLLLRSRHRYGHTVQEDVLGALAREPLTLIAPGQIS